MAMHLGRPHLEQIFAPSFDQLRRDCSGSVLVPRDLGDQCRALVCYLSMLLLMISSPMLRGPQAVGYSLDFSSAQPQRFYFRCVSNRLTFLHRIWTLNGLAQLQL